jgi:hypothetical protein
VYKPLVHLFVDEDIEDAVPGLVNSFNLFMNMYPLPVRKFLPWLLSILAIVIVLAVLGGAALNQWLGGEGFHTLLEQKSATALHAKTSFGPLHLEWFGLSSPHFNAEGQGASSLRQLQLGGLHGRLDPAGLLQGLWHIEEITLERAALHLDTARHPKDPSLSIHAQAREESPSSLPSWFPTTLAIDLIKATKADLFIALPSGNELALRGTHIEVRPEGAETRVEARGGQLTSSYLPELDLKTLRCRIKPDLVDLTGTDLQFPSGGTLQLEGIFPDTKASFLTAHWEKVPLATLMPRFAGHLNGTLDGDATIAWDAAGVMSVQGRVNADKTVLLGIPMMEEIAQLTRMEAFDHLYLQQAHASFVIKNDSSSWHDVVLESQGLIKLIGDASVQKDGSFEGNFQLGLSTPIVTAIPGASLIFSQDQHDGYFWTPLKVGGSLSNFTEDLTSRVTAAVMSHPGLLIQEGLKRGLKLLGAPDAPMNQQSNPPSQSPVPVDPAKAALDILGGFLK